MNFVIYSEETGEIKRTFQGPPTEIESQLAEGEAAAFGDGNWTTHKVVLGEMVELDTPRSPPFDGASWDFDTAEWFDPMERIETRAAARALRLTVLIAEIVELEGRQSRPMREIEMARINSLPLPPASITVLNELDSAISDVRSEIAALGD